MAKHGFLFLQAEGTEADLRGGGFSEQRRPRKQAQWHISPAVMAGAARRSHILGARRLVPMRVCVPVVVSRCLEPGLVAVCVRLMGSAVSGIRRNHVHSVVPTGRAFDQGVQEQVWVVHVMECTRMCARNCALVAV